MPKIRGLTVGFIAVALVVLGLTGHTAPPAETRGYIQNPYAEVDWSEYGRYKANMHTHTTESDGAMTPAAKIDEYHRLGYRILALTDHDTWSPSSPTWPWTAYGRDPNGLDPVMLAVQGNEISRPNHIGSYFNDYGDPDQTSETEALAEIGARNGLAVLFHPGRYNRTVAWYVDLYTNPDHDQLVGLEVYNQGDRHPNDRRLWDRILAETMPGRPVWGYANDDAHQLAHVGRNWQMFLLPELTETALRHAMTNGHFYFAYTSTRGDPAPTIERISVDEANWTITIEAEGYDEIAWLHEGEVVGTEATIMVAGIRGVLRAELRDTSVSGQTRKSYTQPFYIEPPPAGPLLRVR